MLDRTRELMNGRLESIGEIAFHTSLDAKWLEKFSIQSGMRSKLWDIGKVSLLHNWLMLLELACPIQRYGCNYAIRVIGDAACYTEKARLLSITTGIGPLGECWSVWQRAYARLDGLRKMDDWIILPGDDREMANLLRYWAAVGSTVELQRKHEARHNCSLK
jgi:hypothetical protein